MLLIVPVFRLLRRLPLEVIPNRIRKDYNLRTPETCEQLHRTQSGKSVNNIAVFRNPINELQCLCEQGGPPMPAQANVPKGDNADDKPRVRWLEVAPEWAGQRLDNFLLGLFRGVPKSVIYRVIRKGSVRVNRKRARPDYRIVGADSIRVPPLHAPASAAEKAQPGSRVQRRMLDAVVHEESDFLVVNKPPGIAVHGGSGVDFGLIETLRAARDDRYLELVHRLDRDTSGVILIARRRSALRALQEQLRRKSMRKCYQVLVMGHWPEEIDRVNEPLKRTQTPSGERMVRPDSQEGRSAETRFRVLECFEGYTLMEAVPVTGRTHQIRVHAAISGHPVAGDSKYMDDAAMAAWRRIGGQRLMLHAHRLTLYRPGGATERSTFEAPLERRFCKTLRWLREREIQ